MITNEIQAIIQADLNKPIHAMYQRGAWVEVVFGLNRISCYYLIVGNEIIDVQFD